MSAAPKCRVCGGDDVVVWDELHPERAICMDCCPNADHHDGEHGHQFHYERGEGWECQYCCAPPDEDFVAWLSEAVVP